MPKPLLEPFHIVAGVNRAEAHLQAGRKEEAVDQAHRTLKLLEGQPSSIRADSYDAPHYPPGFDVFEVEWERAACSSAGDIDKEHEAKRALLRACQAASISERSF